MSGAFTLETTDTDLQTLRTIVDARRRKGTRTIAVEPDILRRVLNDHHTLWTAAQRKVPWKPGQDQESLT